MPDEKQPQTPEEWEQHRVRHRLSPEELARYTDEHGGISRDVPHPEVNWSDVIPDGAFGFTPAPAGPAPDGEQPEDAKARAMREEASITEEQRQAHRDRVSGGRHYADPPE